MPGPRSVSVHGDAAGNVITTGDSNRIDAKAQATLTRTTLPPPDTVDVGQELAQIRAILEQIGGENAGRIGRALEDATEEASRPDPNKDEIGSALERALRYAKASAGFAEEASKLAPHVKNLAGWLGANWHKILALVGLVV